MVVTVFCSAFQLSSQAQDAYQVGTISGINISQKLEKNWKINCSIDSRLIGIQSYFQQNDDWDWDYRLTDITTVASKKIQSGQKFGFGYLLRLKEGEVNHRLIQQYTIVQSLNSAKLAHRFVADQTFLEEEPMKWRVRYRISTELPFSGQQVDSREFYFKGSNEYLNIMQASDHDLEVRFVPLFGYMLSENLKVEWGLDYRIKNFLYASPKHTFWGIAKCYWSLRKAKKT